MKALRDLKFWISCPHYTSLQIDGIRWNCFSKESPGIDEVLEWQDWAERESTPDQKRIEKFLSFQDLNGKNLLHVGIGNSELAKNFCSGADAIDGITIQNQEYKKGRELGIANYRVFLLNKYSAVMPAILGASYDVIIDNNPSSFACCRKHFYTMLNNYVLLLKPGGEIITDKLGLGWSVTENDLRWRLTPEHWIKIGSYFKLQPVRYDESVLALRKAP